MLKRRVSAGVALSVTSLALLALTLSLSAVAAAAPITVNLRVEGSTETLFEGSVSAEGITNPPGLKTGSSSEAHPCDFKDNGKNGGEGADAVTPTAALYDAAVANKLAFNATWSSEFNDFFVTQVGNDIEGGPPNYEAWGYAVNYTTANVGGCQFQLAPGSEVLWAYNYFNLKHLLNLSGPSSVEAGVPFTVHVTDGQTGEPISGASIGEDVNGVATTIPSSPATNSDGNATITLSHTGGIKLKATRPESVRSNGLTVNVNSVPCGCVAVSPLIPATPGPTPTDIAKIEGVKNGHVYPRSKAPRILTGVVSVPANGTLRQVRISLKRRQGRRCYYFSGAREKFMRLKCSRPAQFFSVGGSESFSYLLPSKLPPGKYVYAIEAVNDAGQTTALVNGASDVAFTVR